MCVVRAVEGCLVTWETTSAIRGLPDSVAPNVMRAGLHAEDEGWTVKATYTTQPPSVVLRFSRDDELGIWAMWNDGHFWRAYAQNAQRLSYNDLKLVLSDPSLAVRVSDDDFDDAIVNIAP